MVLELYLDTAIRKVDTVRSVNISGNVLVLDLREVRTRQTVLNSVLITVWLVGLGYGCGDSVGR